MVDDRVVRVGVVGEPPRSRWEEQLYGRVVVDHALSRYCARL